MAPGSLKTYRKKRDFRNTPEPKGKSTGKRGTKSIFVIHKHAARQLHYDFRLQVGRALSPGLCRRALRVIQPTSVWLSRSKTILSTTRSSKVLSPRANMEPGQC
jgi:hypothetical protein